MLHYRLINTVFRRTKRYLPFMFGHLTFKRTLACLRFQVLSSIFDTGRICTVFYHPDVNQGHLECNLCPIKQFFSSKLIFSRIRKFRRGRR